MLRSCAQVIRTTVAVLNWHRVLTDGQTGRQAGRQAMAIADLG